jgi:alpha-galactosidase/6-phospho-beta-glucosidase family protein
MTADPSKIDLKPSREAMSMTMVSLLTGKPMVDVFNLPNTGQIDNLPRGVVVETMGTVTANRIMPHAVGRLPDDMATLLNHHATRFAMILEASIKGDRRLAMEALASDPLVTDWSIAGELLDKMIKANKRYLPQFK